MPGSYIPTRDVDLAAWADNFRDVINANTAGYGLQPADATAISSLVNAFDAAYALAVNPATRTASTIAAKDSAKGAMVPELRLYAQMIKANPGVSNELKVAAGIHVDDSTPTPVPDPTSVPSLSVASQFHLTTTIDLRATETPLSRAKAPGAAGAVFFASVNPAADPPPSDPAVAPFEAIATRNLTTLTFDASESGKRCTLWARWFNRKGRLGPWSAARSFIIP